MSFKKSIIARGIVLIISILFLAIVIGSEAKDETPGDNTPVQVSNNKTEEGPVFTSKFTEERKHEISDPLFEELTKNPPADGIYNPDYDFSRSDSIYKNDKNYQKEYYSALDYAYSGAACIKSSEEKRHYTGIINKNGFVIYAPTETLAIITINYDINKYYVIKDYQGESVISKNTYLDFVTGKKLEEDITDFNVTLMEDYLDKFDHGTIDRRPGWIQTREYTEFDNAEYKNMIKKVSKDASTTRSKELQKNQMTETVPQKRTKEILIIALILVILVVVVKSFYDCFTMLRGVANAKAESSGTKQDQIIAQINEDYTGLEKALKQRMDTIENTYPGYDEYRYHLSEINHNPYQLMTLLTVLYKEYTSSELQNMLQTLFDSQYNLATQRIVEKRSKEEIRTGERAIHHEDGTTSKETYPYTVTKHFDYCILVTTLTNETIDTAIRNLGLREDQMDQYERALARHAE